VPRAAMQPLPPEQRNELARFQLIELHSVPAAGWQDIELGWISRGYSEFRTSSLPKGALARIRR
jgi:hypothetical protein